MACPFVSGVAALVWSKYPSFTNKEVREQIEDTADNIDSLNPGYKGLLGTGRINAYNALIFSDVTPPAPIKTLDADRIGCTEGQIRLVWIATGDNGYAGDIEDGWYWIEYTTNSKADLGDPSNTTILFSTSIVAISQQVYYINGLKPGVTYYFWITLIDEALNFSDLSNKATAWAQVDVTPPAKITDLIATVGIKAGEVRLSWTAPGDDGTAGRANYYEIRYSTVGFGVGNYQYSVIPYYWVDGVTDGIIISDSDDISEKVSLPFPFTFYGNTYTSLWICSNGFISFTDSDVSYDNTFVPNSNSPNNTICALWDDLNPKASGSGKIYYKSEPNRFIITWDNVYKNGATNPQRFQIILYSDDKIDINYASITSDARDSSTVGIENADGTQGIQYRYNTTGQPIYNNLSLRFKRTFEWEDAFVWKSSRAVGGSSGFIETEVITGLEPNKIYYFAIKTCDERINWSRISNVTTSYATPLWGVIVSTGRITEESTAYTNARRLVRDSLGNLYLAYTKIYPPHYGVSQVFVAKSTDNGQTWQDIGNAPFQHSWDWQFYPSLVVDSVNNLHCVWQEYDLVYEGYQIFYSRYNGLSWTEKINISEVPNYDQFTPAIAIDSQDNLHVVWTGGDSTFGEYSQIKYSSYDKATNVWSTPINISKIANYQQLCPSIAVDSKDNVHIVWSGKDHIREFADQIKYIRKTPTGWTQWINIPQPVFYSQLCPSIAIDSEDNLHVVWYGSDSTYWSTYQVKYASYNAKMDKWGQWMNINPIPYSQYNPSIAIDKNNGLHIFWHGRDLENPTEPQIKYSSATLPALTWSSWKNLTNSYAQNVTVRWQNFFTNDGNLDYCWTNLKFECVMFNHNLSVNLSPGATVYYSISGVVTDSEGNPLQGITVNLTGAMAISTITHSNGRYEFSGLPWKHSYTVTPISANWFFEPVSRSTGSLSKNITNWDFVGMPYYGYIAGKVTSTIDGSALVGAVIEVIKDETVKYTTTVGADGNYSIKVATGSYDVRVSSTGYIPKMEQNITVVYAATTTVNFALAPAIGFVVGNVKKMNGIGVYQAKIELKQKDKDEVLKSLLTDKYGNYSFSVLEGEYSIYVTKQKYKPVEKSLQIIAGSTITLNFVLEEEFEEILEESEKEIIIPQKEGEIKVFGGSKSKGVINPEIGEKVKVGFRGKEQGRYTLRVFNLLGELVYQETKENVVEGIFEWLPKDIASGTYIVYVEGPGVKSFKKIAILR